MKKRTYNLILFLILILILPSITCNILNPKDAPDQSSEVADPPGEVSLSDSSETALPEATGDDIRIGKTAAYQDVFGLWNIHGLVTNVAAYPVGGIELELSLLNDGESSVNAQTIFPAPDGLAPGETQPFGIRLPAEVSSMDQFDVDVLQIIRIEKEVVQLETSGVNLSTSDDGIVTLTGELLNTNDLPAAINSIRAALFSADGEIITTETCQVCTRYLPPGGSGPFQFLIFGHPQEAVVDHYEIYSSAEGGTFIDDFDVTFSELDQAYNDPAGNFHLLGDIQNDSDQILDLRLLATFYDQNQFIVGAAAYNLPLSSLVPGESSPYDISSIGPINAVDWSIQVDLAGSRVVDSPSYTLSTTGDEDNIAEYLSTFSGQVVNDTGETLQIILVVIGLREKSTGRLVGLSSSLITGEFPPGSTVEYNLNVSPDPGVDPATLEKFILTRGR